MTAHHHPTPRKTLGLWDRGDGYDDRDPNAPEVNRCGGCDAVILDGACADCTVFIEAIPHPVHGYAIVDAAA